MIDRASCIDLNQCWFKHPSLKRPLNDSTNAFCVGLPGWMKCSFTLFSCDQKNIALHVSSGPLSQTIVFGSGRFCSLRKRASLTPEIEVSVSCPTHSRLKSSTIFRTRNRRPVASWSDTKSIDHLSLQRTGTTIGTLGLINFLRFLVRTWSPSSQ